MGTCKEGVQKMMCKGRVELRGIIKTGVQRNDVQMGLGLKRGLQKDDWGGGGCGQKAIRLSHYKPPPPPSEKKKTRRPSPPPLPQREAALRGGPLTPHPTPAHLLRGGPDCAAAAFEPSVAVCWGGSGGRFFCMAESGGKGEILVGGGSAKK